MPQIDPVDHIISINGNNLSEQHQYQKPQRDKRKEREFKQKYT